MISFSCVYREGDREVGRERGRKRDGEKEREEERWREKGRKREKEGEKASLGSLVPLLIRTLILLDQGPILMIAFNLNYLITSLKTLPPNIASLEVRASTHEFDGGGGMNFSLEHTETLFVESDANFQWFSSELYCSTSTWGVKQNKR